MTPRPPPSMRAGALAAEPRAVAEGAWGSAWRTLLFALLLAACWDSPSATRLPLRVEPVSAELDVGHTLRLAAINSERGISWESSDSAVATVAARTGLVIAQAAGTTRITARSGGDAASATIRVRIPPAVSLSSSTVTFAAVAAGSDPPEHSLQITNGGEGELTGLNASASYPGDGAADWLRLELSATAAPATLTLRPVTRGLAAGTHTATVLVGSATPGAAEASVAVTFQVDRAPVIGLPTETVAFSAVAGGADPEPVRLTVSNAGGGALVGLSVAAAPAWLEPSLSATSAPATLTLAPRVADVPPGTYTGSVRLSSSVAGVDDASVAVELTIAAPEREPVIALSASAVSFTATAGAADPPAADVAVTNGGGGTLSGLSISGAPSWLTASLSGLAAPATISLRTATAELAPGAYRDTLTVSSSLAGVASKEIEVELTVAPDPRPPSIELSASSLTFSAYAGGPATAPQTVEITNGGGGTLGGLSVSGLPLWLTAALSATTAPATLTLQASGGDHGPRTYTAAVEVSSAAPGAAARTVQVTFEIKPPPR